MLSESVVRFELVIRWFETKPKVKL
jgi:hypothetical protein